LGKHEERIKKEGEEREKKEWSRRAHVLANYERSPILPKTTDFGTDIDSRRRYRHMPGFSGCPTSAVRGWESIAARNNLQPFEPDVSAVVFVKENERHGYRVYLTSKIRSIM